jgi:glycosidase
MQWDATKNAGFTTGTPWLPVPPSYVTVNVKAEEANPDSMLAWYKRLIQLKKTNTVMAQGANVLLDTDNTKVLSWMRQKAGEPPVVVSVNFTPDPQTVNLTGGSSALKSGPLKTLLKSPAGADPASPDHIELGAFGVYIGQMQ